MQSNLLFFIASSLVLQPIFAGAEEPSLETRLRDMPGEVARFLETKAPGWAVAHQETTAQRVRAKALEASRGSEVTFTLRDGEKVMGQLADVSEAGFTIRVAASEDVRKSRGDNVSTTKDYRFADVRLFLVGPDPRQVPAGKTVEVRLVGGKKIKGELTAVAEDGITVNGRPLAFDDVLSVKTVMRNRTKTLIIVGTTVPLLIFLGYAYAAALGS